MTEKFITIVKIRGKGAGVESMTEVLESTWAKMQKESPRDTVDWKVVTKKADAVVEVEVEEPAKSPEEIEAEAVAALGAEPKKKKKVT